MARYQLVRRLAARRWHLAGQWGRALCGVAMTGADTRTLETSDLRQLTCPDCLAMLTGKLRRVP